MGFHRLARKGYAAMSAEGRRMVEVYTTGPVRPHYLSPHYDDMARMWADGQQIPMHFGSYDQLPNRLMLNPF